jgi:hypothetical protein
VIKTERMGWLALAGIGAVVAVIAALPIDPAARPRPATAMPAAAPDTLVFEENLGQTDARSPRLLSGRPGELNRSRWASSLTS